MLLTIAFLPAANIRAEDVKQGMKDTKEASKAQENESRKWREYKFEQILLQKDKDQLMSIKGNFYTSTSDVRKNMKLLREEMKGFVQSKNDNFVVHDLENIYQRAIKMRRLKEQLLQLRHRRDVDIVNLLSQYPEHQKKFLNRLIKYKHRGRKKDRSQASVVW